MFNTVEEPRDVKLEIVPVRLGIRRFVGAIIFVPVPGIASGRQWCNMAAHGKISGVTVDEAVLTGDNEEHWEFFMAVSIGEDRRAWVFSGPSYEDTQELADDVRRIIEKSTPQYICATVPEAGIIFNGMDFQG